MDGGWGCRTEAAHLCSLAVNENGWAKHVRDGFPECAKAADAADATNGGGSNDDDDDDDDDGDDDDDQAAPADEWTNSKLFHWDAFVGWTSGCHWPAAHMHRLACV